MSDEYIKLEKPPEFTIQYPQCGTCLVDLFTDSDDWQCPVCGTSWPMNAGDGEPGTLYEDWSGETLDVPVSSSTEAISAGVRYERAANDAALRRLGITRR